MRHILPILMQYRYLILASLSLLHISEMWLAFATSVPIRYESLLGWALLITLSILIGMGALIGVIAPVEEKGAKCFYGILVCCSQCFFVIIASFVINGGFEGILLWRLSFAIVACLGIVVLFRSVTSIGYVGMLRYAILILIVFITLAIVDPDTGRVWFDIFEYIAVITLVAWVVMAGMISVLSPDLHDAKGYVFVVVLPVMLLACIGVFASLFVSVYYANIWFLLVTLFALLVTILGAIALRTRPLPMGPVVYPGYKIVCRYRNVLIAAIVLWALLSITGWFWAATMSNGLDTFTGREFLMAQNALVDATICDYRLDPTQYRVIKVNGSVFRVQGFTWWGIPAGLPCHRQRD